MTKLIWDLLVQVNTNLVNPKLIKSSGHHSISKSCYPLAKNYSLLINPVTYQPVPPLVLSTCFSKIISSYYMDHIFLDIKI